MAAASQEQAEQAPAKARVPWRKRFHAWWEGYELIVRETFGEDEEPEAENVGAAKEAPGEIGPAAAETDGENEEPEAASDAAAQEATGEIEPVVTESWPQERVALIQRIWGEGFDSPGGAFHILDLVKPLSLNADRRLLHFGAGLGGPAHLLDETFDLHVKGWEINPELAAAGGPKVQLYEPEAAAGRADVFDFIFSKEVLFKLADKDGLFEVLKENLAERGEIIFTDYVLADDGGDDPAVQAWLDAEPVTRFPVSAEDHLARLERLGLDVRSNEDMTDTHNHLVLRGWEYFLESLAKEQPEPVQLPFLRKELEVWARRMQLMAAGKLKVCCIHACRS